MRRVWALALAVLTGIPLALFFVFAPLYTDGPGSVLHPERLVSFALTLALYAVAGGLLSAAGRGDRLIPFVLAAPALAVVLAYVPRESQVAGLAVAYLLLALGGGFVGLWLVRRRRPVAGAPKTSG